MDLENVHIEFTTAAEYAQLAAELHKQCFDSPWGEASFRSALTIPGTIAQFLSKNEIPVGFALYRQMQEEAEVLTFCVLPKLRRGGIGRQLLDTGIEYFRQARVRAIFLEVNAANNSAIELYKNSGFIQIGRRKGYYSGGNGRQDALILKLSCADSIQPKNNEKTD
ncbi:MAG: ribosomal protein S18-alanine N-acetyltransferase [Proteobacteria bacterium]|nr:ribosomal protein S18-alanine N-acetyltransferase [Pseudomonadota bacterium]